MSEMLLVIMLAGRRAAARRNRSALCPAAPAGRSRMTPFGERMRLLRRRKGVTQRQMAEAIGVSAAYLSALEHGRRGAPNWALVQKIVGYFNVIWDDAEELQRLAESSHPRVVVDTAGLSPKATALANRLASEIARLDDRALDQLSAIIESRRKS